jgi:hypothetical protein
MLIHTAEGVSCDKTASNLFSANVRYWHKADMLNAPTKVRYRG